MKVLMINSVCGIKSTGRICTDLAEILEQNGHECKIAYGRDTVPEKYRKYAIKIGTDLDLKLHGIQTRLFDRHGLGSKRATKKLVAKIKQYDPDIIHLHNLHGYYLNLPVLFEYLRESKKPVVWTLHDCWTFTGHCAHFLASGCDKWKTECHSCPSLRDYPKSYLDNSRRMYRLKKKCFLKIESMTVATPSEWLSDLVKQSFLKDYPIKVINNGIDLSSFKPTDSNFRSKYGCEDKYVLLGVASAWNDKKGLDVFVELSKRLPSEYQIVLVGTDSFVDRQLPDNIISIHRTHNKVELAEIYSAADLLVQPTREDTYPTVNIEALACGTPVLTFKTGGSPEIADDTCGYVVDVDDISAMEREIVRICQNKSYAAEACVKRAGGFDKTLRFEKYVDLYNEILEKKNI